VADARDGRRLRTLQGPDGTLMHPRGVAMVPRTGQVLVLDYQRGLVVVFAGVDNDTVVRTLGDGRGHGPRQLGHEDSDDEGPEGIAVLDEGEAVDRPIAVVAYTHNHRLSLFRVDDDTLLRHVGSKGWAPGEFNSPSAVSVVSSKLTGSDEEWLVVADSGNRRVQVLTLLGAVVRVLTGDGVGPFIGLAVNESRFFRVPVGTGMITDIVPPLKFGGATVCVATGEVLVTDYWNHRVVSWRLSDGGGCRVVPVCGRSVAESGNRHCRLHYSHPIGVVMTSDGALWVADSQNSRLCLFR
jgi:hypothetical protein